MEAVAVADRLSILSGGRWSEMQEGWEEALRALFAREEIEWRLVGGCGDGRRVRGDSAEDRAELVEMLRADPHLVLLGMEASGSAIEVRWAEGGLRVRRDALAGSLGGFGLREERPDPRIDGRALTEILRRREKGILGEARRRRLAMAAFLGRVLDLLAGIKEPHILECGAGPAPVGLALAASLARAGIACRLTLADSSAEAMASAGELASRLGLEADLLVGEIADLRPQPPVHLLLAVHLCGPAVYEAIALGLRADAPRMVLVPCCAPAGAWAGLGLSYYGGAAHHPLLRERLDHLGLVLSCLDRLAEGGYDVQVFAAHLPPWRAAEISLLAYRPARLGKTSAGR